MADISYRGITKTVLVPAPADREWTAAVGMDLVIHYEVREAESGRTLFSTRGKLPRSLRVQAAFAETDVGAALTTMREGEAASFTFALRADNVPPALAPLVFGPDPPVVPTVLSDSDSDSEEARRRRRLMTPLDHARAAVAKHDIDDALSRGDEAKAAARREERARARAAAIKHAASVRQALTLRRRGAASVDMLFPPDATRPEPADDACGAAAPPSHAALVLPALGQNVDFRVYALLVTGRKNIDEQGRLMKETLGFAPYALFPACTGPSDDGAVLPPLLPPAQLEALRQAGEPAFSPEPAGGDARRPRSGDRVWLRIRLAIAGLGDVLGCALPRWAPAPAADSAAAPTTTAGAAAAAASERGQATTVDAPVVSVCTAVWTGAEAVFGSLQSGLAGAPESGSGSDVVAQPLLLSGIPVRVVSSPAPAAADGPSLARLQSMSQWLAPRVWITEAWTSAVDPLAKGLPAVPAVPATAAPPAAPVSALTVGSDAPAAYEDGGVVTSFVVDGAATWLPWAVEETVGTCARGEVARLWAKPEPYGFGSGFDWGVPVPPNSGIYAEIHVLGFAPDAATAAAAVQAAAEEAAAAEKAAEKAVAETAAAAAAEVETAKGASIAAEAAAAGVTLAGECSSLPSSAPAPVTAAGAAEAEASENKPPVLDAWTAGKIIMMRKIKDIANVYYARGNENAERCERLWARALGLFHLDAPLPLSALAAVKALRVACFSNMSASRARIGDRAGLREAVEETLKIDPNHIKSLVRRAHERVKTAHLDEALADATHALAQRPEDAALTALVTAVKQRIAAAQKAERALYTRAFERSQRGH